MRVKGAERHTPLPHTKLEKKGEKGEKRRAERKEGRGKREEKKECKKREKKKEKKEEKRKIKLGYSFRERRSKKRSGKISWDETIDYVTVAPNDVVGRDLDIPMSL